MDAYTQFFVEVRALEDRLAAETALPPLALVPPERMQQQLAQGLPLLPLVPPAIPADQFLAHLTQYRALLRRFKPELGDDLDAQERALRGIRPEVAALLVEGLLHIQNDVIYDTCQDLGIAPERFFFLGQLALRPYLAAYGERLEAVVEFDAYRGTFCPVCGRRPAMGRIDGDNVKHLHCPACDHVWRAHRIACYNCGSAESEKLGFFTVEGNDERRVEHCSECGDYLKVLNQRIRGRKVDFLVEDAATLHLDQLAEAEGYVKGGRETHARLL